MTKKTPDNFSEVSALLDEIGSDLRVKGITLEELKESGREIRGDLLKELYDIDPNDTSNGLQDAIDQGVKEIKQGEIVPLESILDD